MLHRNSSLRVGEKLAVKVPGRQFPIWSHGVMVSTQDSESCDPSSNLGGISVGPETFQWVDDQMLGPLVNFIAIFPG